MKEREVTFEQIQATIKNPLKTSNNILDEYGRWGYKIIVLKDN